MEEIKQFFKKSKYPTIVSFIDLNEENSKIILNFIKNNIISITNNAVILKILWMYPFFKRELQ